MLSEFRRDLEHDALVRKNRRRQGQADAEGLVFDACRPQSLGRRNGEFAPGEEARTLPGERDQRGLGEHACHAVAFQETYVQAKSRLPEVEKEAESLRERVVVLASDGAIGCERYGAQRRRRKDAEAESAGVGAGAEDVEPGLLEHAAIELDDLDFDLHRVASDVDTRTIKQHRFFSAGRRGRVTCFLVRIHAVE